jgi:hypothetical protein
LSLEHRTVLNVPEVERHMAEEARRYGYAGPSLRLAG